NIRCINRNLSASLQKEENLDEDILEWSQGSIKLFGKFMLERISKHSIK
ncbi:17026_t:CDS:1, partial [Racocetra persica]